jgi:hypothetical protein
MLCTCWHLAADWSETPNGAAIVVRSEREFEACTNAHEGILDAYSSRVVSARDVGGCLKAGSPKNPAESLHQRGQGSYTRTLLSGISQVLRLEGQTLLSVFCEVYRSENSFELSCSSSRKTLENLLPHSNTAP